MSVAQAGVLQADAWDLQERGELDAAAEKLQAAIESARRDGAEAVLDVANLLTDLAEVEHERGHIQAALSLGREVVSWIDTVSGVADRPTAARIKLRALERCGAALTALGQYADAERDLLTGIELASVSFGDGAGEVTQLRNVLGMLYKYWGRWEDGLLQYDQVLSCVLATQGEQSDDAARIYHNIGGLLHARGCPDTAEAPARRAWDIARALHGESDVETMIHAEAYAAILDDLGRQDDGLEIHRAALAVFTSRFGPEHPEVAATLHNLAAALAATGLLAEAEGSYRRALAMKERAAGGDAPDTALTRQNLGHLLCMRGQRDEGVRLLTSALTTLEARLPPEHPSVVVARQNLARVST